MRWFAFLALVLFAGFLGGPAPAQQPGTVVQLPTFSQFSTSTTVVVPDRGSTLMGGVSRGATGRSEFGVPLLPFRPFRNSAIAGERSASRMRVTATIHDFEAMDNYLLNQPTAGRYSSPRGWGGSAAERGRGIEPREPSRGASWQLAAPAEDARPKPFDLQAAKAHRRAQQQTRHAEAEGFFQRGRQAEAEGKSGAARIFYQMAARRADETLKPQIVARLEAMELTKTAAGVAQSAR